MFFAVNIIFSVIKCCYSFQNDPRKQRSWEDGLRSAWRRPAEHWIELPGTAMEPYVPLNQLDTVLFILSGKQLSLRSFTFNLFFFSSLNEWSCIQKWEGNCEPECCWTVDTFLQHSLLQYQNCSSSVLTTIFMRSITAVGVTFGLI